MCYIYVRIWLLDIFLCLDHLFETSLKVFISAVGDFVALLNVITDEKVLPTTYGQLRPPLGSHRLKVRFLCEIFSYRLLEGLIIRWTCHQILELRVYLFVVSSVLLFSFDFLCFADDFVLDCGVHCCFVENSK